MRLESVKVANEIYQDELKDLRHQLDDRSVSLTSGMYDIQVKLDCLFEGFGGGLRY